MIANAIVILHSFLVIFFPAESLLWRQVAELDLVSSKTLAKENDDGLVFLPMHPAHS